MHCLAELLLAIDFSARNYHNPSDCEGMSGVNVGMEAHGLSGSQSCLLRRGAVMNGLIFELSATTFMAGATPVMPTTLTR
mmetsp:Transcript_9364/g.22193  ORF Transcript_9364/g.22193 Transcript_9364/m.22193 type:complete len:80 (+) Transcript_9364:152-391(+)